MVLSLLNMYVKQYFTYHHMTEVSAMHKHFEKVADNLFRPIYVNLSR